MMIKRFFATIIMCMAFSVSCVCGGHSVAEQGEGAGIDTAFSGLSSDTVRTAAHESVTWDLITLVEHDSRLKDLLENPSDRLWSKIRTETRILWIHWNHIMRS